MKITDEMISDFAHEAIGLSSAMYEIFDSMYPGADFDALSTRQLSIIDDIAFTCAYCGWIYDLGEESGYDEDERICINCADEAAEFDE